MSLGEMSYPKIIDSKNYQISEKSIQELFDLEKELRELFEAWRNVIKGKRLTKKSTAEEIEQFNLASQQMDLINQLWMSVCIKLGDKSPIATINHITHIMEYITLIKIQEKRKTYEMIRKMGEENRNEIHEFEPECIQPSKDHQNQAIPTSEYSESTRLEIKEANANTKARNQEQLMENNNKKVQRKLTEYIGQ